MSEVNVSNATFSGERIEFTKEMRKDYTILIPDMLPVHFKLIRNVLTQHGYRVGLLKNTGRKVVDTGLKYVHNDTCYPALLVIGQMISALQSGKYDVNKVALMITQTGGGCRASNYIHLLRKALQKAGLGHVPVISLNISGLESNSGFSLTLEMLYQALIGLTYGDLFMLLKNQVRSYEVNKGDADELIAKWVKELSAQLHKVTWQRVLDVGRVSNPTTTLVSTMIHSIEKKNSHNSNPTWC